MLSCVLTADYCSGFAESYGDADLGQSRTGGRVIFLRAPQLPASEDTG